jgi:hypothetical protein
VDYRFDRHLFPLQPADGARLSEAPAHIVCWWAPIALADRLDFRTRRCDRVKAPTPLRGR